MSATRVARVLTCLALAFSAIAGGAGQAQTKSTKAAKKPGPAITFATKPAPPTTGETTFTVTARDAAGKPITGADVLVELVMPPIAGMGAMKNTVTLKAASDPKQAAEGTYTGTGQFLMAGKWIAAIDVKVGGKSVARQKVTIDAR